MQVMMALCSAQRQLTSVLMVRAVRSLLSDKAVRSSPALVFGDVPNTGNTTLGHASELRNGNLKGRQEDEERSEHCRRGLHDFR